MIPLTLTQVERFMEIYGDLSGGLSYFNAVDDLCKALTLNAA